MHYKSNVKRYKSNRGTTQVPSTEYVCWILVFTVTQNEAAVQLYVLMYICLQMYVLMCVVCINRCIVC